MNISLLLGLLFAIISIQNIACFTLILQYFALRMYNEEQFPGGSLQRDPPLPSSQRCETFCGTNSGWAFLKFSTSVPRLNLDLKPIKNECEMCLLPFRKERPLQYGRRAGGTGYKLNCTVPRLGHRLVFSPQTTQRKLGAGRGGEVSDILILPEWPHV